MNPHDPPPQHRRLRLDLAYCGTPWRGWQSRPEGDAVQDQVHAALRRLTKIPDLACEAASRTDAGVHALGQVAHFDLPDTFRVPGDAIRNGLNGLLPETIRALAVTGVAPGFHATLSAAGKIYRYRIWRLREMDPFEADRAWHVREPLDLDLFRQAARVVEGTHNFVRLSANPGAVPEAERRRDVPGHTRTLCRIELRETPRTLEVELEGDAFLYHMARLTMGALVQVARGRATLEWLIDLLAAPEGLQSQTLAPAGGLYLVKVLYLALAGARFPAG